MDSKEDVLRKIADALNIEPARITPDTQAEDVEDWDSMGTMAILLMLDKEYGVKLAPNETKDLQNVAGILQVLQRAGKLS